MVFGGSFKVPFEGSLAPLRFAVPLRVPESVPVPSVVPVTALGKFLCGF